MLLKIMNLHAQDNTGEALKARRNNGTVFVKEISENGKTILVFSPDKKTYNYKNVISVAVPERFQNLILSAEFKNPLEYKISTTITSVDDPASQAISKFLDQVAAFNTLINSQKVEATEAGDLPGPGLVPFNNLSGRQILETKINAPSLAEWKYHLLKNKDEDCIRDLKTLAMLIYYVDTSYYSEKVAPTDFSMVFLESFKDLNEAGNAADYMKSFSAFEECIKMLEKRGEKNKEHHNNLKKHKNDILSIAETIPLGKDYCDYFIAFTKEEVEQFLIATENIQKNREGLLEAAKALITELAKFNKTLEKSEKNYTDYQLLNYVEVDPKKIHDIKVLYKKQKVEVTKMEIKITEEEESFTGNVKLRAHRTFIPEISTGVFYTTLRYPKFGTKEDSSGGFIVAEAGEDKYNVVAATHLNLVANVFDGDVHPMLQVGIGTAKDLPSLLGGGGLRFTGSVKCAISFGAIFTWRKELDELKIGDTIDGTAKLEDDLKYRLQKKPGFYIGLQYNF